MALTWNETGTNEITADHAPYRYVVWSKDDGSSVLRIIRRELTQGVIIPYEDFAMTVDTMESAQALAEKIDELFQPFNAYNPPGSFS